MARQADSTLYPRKLQRGDRVRLISPASTPTREGVDRFVKILRDWGLEPEVAPHAFDTYGSYLAGTDEARLADLNDAFRDPGVRAVIATRGGAGAYRIVDGMDVEVMRRDPKLVVGFSDVTIIQLALWARCRVTSIHGGMFSYFGRLPETASAEKLRRALMTDESISLCTRHDEPTSRLTTSGKVEGVLMGGNQDMVAMANGWALPSLEGAILLLEDVGKPLGFIDRQMTMLIEAGCLKGLRGVAVGQYIDCGPKDTPDAHTVVDVLRDRLRLLGVPILGGLPVGHNNDAEPVSLGTWVTLDADAGTLTVKAAAK